MPGATKLSYIESCYHPCFFPLGGVIPSPHPPHPYEDAPSASNRSSVQKKKKTLLRGQRCTDIVQHTVDAILLCTTILFFAVFFHLSTQGNGNRCPYPVVRHGRDDPYYGPCPSPVLVISFLVFGCLPLPLLRRWLLIHPGGGTRGFHPLLAIAAFPGTVVVTLEFGFFPRISSRVIFSSVGGVGGLCLVGGFSLSRGFARRGGFEKSSGGVVVGMACCLVVASLVKQTEMFLPSLGLPDRTTLTGSAKKRYTKENTSFAIRK